jgi:hypothetical protein
MCVVTTGLYPNFYVLLKTYTFSEVFAYLYERLYALDAIFFKRHILTVLLFYLFSLVDLDLLFFLTTKFRMMLYGHIQLYAQKTKHLILNLVYSCVQWSTKTP